MSDNLPYVDDYLDNFLSEAKFRTDVEHELVLKDVLMQLLTKIQQDNLPTEYLAELLVELSRRVYWTINDKTD